MDQCLYLIVWIVSAQLVTSFEECGSRLVDSCHVFVHLCMVWTSTLNNISCVDTSANVALQQRTTQWVVRILLEVHLLVVNRLKVPCHELIFCTAVTDPAPAHVESRNTLLCVSGSNSIMVVRFFGE